MAASAAPGGRQASRRRQGSVTPRLRAGGPVALRCVLHVKQFWSLAGHLRRRKRHGWHSRLPAAAPDGAPQYHDVYVCGPAEWLQPAPDGASLRRHALQPFPTPSLAAADSHLGHSAPSRPHRPSSHRLRLRRPPRPPAGPGPFKKQQPVFPSRGTTRQAGAYATASLWPQVAGRVGWGLGRGRSRVRSCGLRPSSRSQRHWREGAGCPAWQRL